MSFTVLRKMAYADTFIYIMQYGSLFQYIFCFNKEGDLHQDHVIIKPALWRTTLYKFGLLDSEYSRDTLEEVEKILLSGAMKSLDELVSRKSTLSGTSSS